MSHHVVETAYERGWHTLKNSELVEAAESAGFELLVTTDQNLQYQQDLRGRRIAIMVLTTTSWPRIRQQVATLVAAIDAMTTGQYQEMSFPR